jgi:nicotinate-nucleotide adenylyltransferase
VGTSARETGRAAPGHPDKGNNVVSRVQGYRRKIEGNLDEAGGACFGRRKSGDYGSAESGMKIGLFGGTFDPVHKGHLALARAALERCGLHRIYFVPANIPPHKQRQPLSPFAHRFAMLALATAEEKAFVPSLLEAPVEEKNGNRKPREEKPNYTIDTVRSLKRSVKPGDKLFLLIGMDAFADIAKWRESEALFRECEFVVASRPGFSLADVANALPEKLRPRPEVTQPFHKQPATGDLVLPGVTLHLLGDLRQPASATAIRESAAAGKPLGRFVEPAVADYIRKTGLYK